MHTYQQKCILSLYLFFNKQLPTFHINYKCSYQPQNPSGMLTLKKNFWSLLNGCKATTTLYIRLQKPLCGSIQLNNGCIFIIGIFMSNCPPSRPTMPYILSIYIVLRSLMPLYYYIANVSRAVA